MYHYINYCTLECYSCFFFFFYAVADDGYNRELRAAHWTKINKTNSTRIYNTRYLCTHYFINPLNSDAKRFTEFDALGNNNMSRG